MIRAALRVLGVLLLVTTSMSFGDLALARDDGEQRAAYVDGHYLSPESLLASDRDAFDQIVGELSDLEMAYLLLELEDGETGPDGEFAEFAGSGWVRPFLEALERRLQARADLPKGGWGPTLRLMEAQVTSAFSGAMMRRPWLAYWGVLGAGVLLESLDLGPSAGMGAMMLSTNIPWAAERYLRIPYNELHEAVVAMREAITTAEAKRAELSGKITRIKETLEKYLGDKYKDREAKSKRMERMDRIKARLRAMPRSWGVAQGVARRAQDQESVQKLYTYWDQLEETDNHLVNRLNRLREELFLTQSRLEVKHLVGELTKKYEWHEKLSGLLGQTQEFLKRLEVPKGQKVIDFRSRQWVDREKKLKAAIALAAEQIQAMRNALQTNLFILEPDPELLSQIDRSGVARFYEAQAGKEAFAKDMMHWLEQREAKVAPQGVDPALGGVSDFKVVWGEFVQRARAIGVTIRNAPGDKLLVAWDGLPGRKIELRIVPVITSGALEKADIRLGRVELSVKAFTSAALAAEILQQGLDTFIAANGNAEDALFSSIISSLERIANLGDKERHALIVELGRHKVHGTDAAGLQQLVHEYKHNGVSAALIEATSSYMRRAGKILEPSGQRMRQGRLIQMSL